MSLEFDLGDVVKMKKPHPCGTNAWEIVRMGADIRIKCVNCGHFVLLPRAKFVKALRGILHKADN